MNSAVFVIFSEEYIIMGLMKDRKQCRLKHFILSRNGASYSFAFAENI